MGKLFSKSGSGSEKPKQQKSRVTDQDRAVLVFNFCIPRVFNYFTVLRDHPVGSLFSSDGKG